MNETDLAAPPEAVDVVVVGGGIVGSSTAWFLAKAGHSVALCEKGRIAGEQSGRNWGYVRQQGRDPAEMPMIMESLRIWRGLEAEIGEKVGFATGGCLYLARDQEELDDRAKWLPVAEQHQLETRVLDSAGVDAVLDGADGRWFGATYTPSDGRAEPAKAAPAIARAAARHGASVLTNCAVRGVETAAGKVSAVVTERGVIRAGTVVCAAGVWTSLFGGNLGIRIPQLKIKGTVARTAPAPNVNDGAVWSPAIAIRRRDDGGYTVAHGGASIHPIVPDSFRHFSKFIGAYRADRESLRLSLGRRFFEEWSTPRRWALNEVTPFEKTRVLDPAPDQRTLGQMRANLKRWIPAIAAVPFVETWAGMIEATPDALPVICEAETIPGFYIATGFSGHGFGIGPGAGRAIAELVTGVPAKFDMSPFRLSRFYDGTPISSGQAG
ncbi:MAG: FAD-binding oxidoreductase [Pseudomonadota bacterium]|nr:FAD-binding oxidoreductase [Pseudomonadota bacterium]